MSLFSRFSDRIESQNWDHVSFLRNLLLVVAFVLLLLYLWILVMELNGIIAHAYFIHAFQQLVSSQLLGTGLGLVLGFLIILPSYLKSNWDLHIVIPRSLFIILLMAIFIQLLNLLTSWYSEFQESGFLVGFLFGSLLALLAFAGEVQREHQEEPVEE